MPAPNLGLNSLHQEVGAYSQTQTGPGEGKGVRPKPSLHHIPTPPALTWLCSRKAKSHCSLVIKGCELFSVNLSTQCLKLQNEAESIQGKPRASEEPLLTHSTGKRGTQVKGKAAT